MKVEIEKVTQNKVDPSFRGLATDIDGDLWLFTGEGYIFIDVDGLCSIYDVDTFNGESYHKYKPFTKYNGKVTLSND